MTEDEARGFYYGNQERRFQLEGQLAAAKAVDTWCDAGKAFEASGAEAIASDAEFMAAGLVMMEGSPFTGPAGPFVAGAGLAVAAYGALSFSYHSTQVIARSVTGSPAGLKTVGDWFDQNYGFQTTGNAGKDFLRDKALGEGVDKLSKGRGPGLGWPGLGECKVTEKLRKDTRERIENEIQQLTPPDAPKTPTIGPPREQKDKKKKNELRLPPAPAPMSMKLTERTPSIDTTHDGTRLEQKERGHGPYVGPDTPHHSDYA